MKKLANLLRNPIPNLLPKGFLRVLELRRHMEVLLGKLAGKDVNAAKTYVKGKRSR